MREETVSFDRIGLYGAMMAPILEDSPSSFDGAYGSGMLGLANPLGKKGVYVFSGVTPAEIAGVGALAGVSFFLDTPAKKIRVKNKKNQQMKAKN